MRNIDIWAVALLLLTFVAVTELGKSDWSRIGPQTLAQLSAAHFGLDSSECSLMTLHLSRD